MTSPAEPSPLPATASQASGLPASPVLLSQPLFDEVHDWLASQGPLWRPAGDTIWHLDDWTGLLAGSPLAQAQGLLTTPTERVDAHLLDLLPHLRVISQMAVGYNNIDLQACAERGIAVAHTPDILTETTADFAMAMVLGAARGIGAAERQLRAGAWTQWAPTGFLGQDVHGAILGIVGMGRIGQALARRAQLGFGMRVQYHQRNPLPASGMPDPAQAPVWLPLDELLRTSDHVVLLVPYGPDTHHLLDESRLRSMKPTATLSNLARGGVVDDEALARVLADGHLAGAALDVFEGEPQVHPALLQQERVMLTPHMASASHATRRAMAWMAARQLRAGLMAMSGGAPDGPPVRWVPGTHPKRPAG